MNIALLFNCGCKTLFFSFKYNVITEFVLFLYFAGLVNLLAD